MQLKFAVREVFTEFEGYVSQQIDERFQGFKKYCVDIEIFGNPFAVNVDAVLHHLQIVLLELQCDSNYKHLFSTINDAHTFYKQPDMTKYKNLRQRAVRIASFFESTYIYKQAF